MRIYFWVWLIVVSAVMGFLFGWFLCLASHIEIGQASWYSRASCAREKTSGIMANGKELRDDAYTCASWSYPFGTILRVRNRRTGKVVFVRVTDRGPAKRLYREGRIIDLSKAAFSAIGELREGLIKVEVRKVR